MGIGRPYLKDAPARGGSLAQVPFILIYGVVTADFAGRPKEKTSAFKDCSARFFKMVIPLGVPVRKAHTHPGPQLRPKRTL